MDDKFQRQLDERSQQIRRQGVSPRRDLWPEILSSIETAEPQGVRRTGSGRLWRITAIAACLLLVLGLGAITSHGPGLDQAGDRVMGPAQQMTRATVSEAADLQAARQVLSGGLDQIKSALLADPQNPYLLGLLRRMHRKQGSIERVTVQHKTRMGLKS